MTAAPLSNAEIFALRELQARKRAELEQLERRPRAEEPVVVLREAPDDDVTRVSRDPSWMGPGNLQAIPDSLPNRESGISLGSTPREAAPEGRTRGQGDGSPPGGLSPRRRKPTPKVAPYVLVLLRRVLQMFGREEGGLHVAWPSTTTIARLMGCSRRALDHALAAVRANDRDPLRIRRRRSEGQRRESNLYQWQPVRLEGWAIATLSRLALLLKVLPGGARSRGGIGTLERAVLVELALGRGFRTQAEIAAELRITDRAVRHGVAVLVDHGVLRMELAVWAEGSGPRAGQRAASRYAIRFVDGWRDATPVGAAGPFEGPSKALLPEQDAQEGAAASKRVSGEAETKHVLRECCSEHAPSTPEPGGVPEQDAQEGAGQTEGVSRTVTKSHEASGKPSVARVHRNRMRTTTGTGCARPPEQDAQELSAWNSLHGSSRSAEDRSAAAPAAPIETPRTRRARAISDCLFAIGLEHLSDPKSVRRLLAVATKYHPKQPAERLVGAIVTAWAEWDWQSVCARGEQPPPPLAVDEIIRHLRAARPDGSPWRAWDAVGRLIDQGDPTAMELLPMLAEATRQMFAEQGNANARKRLVIANQLIGARAADPEVLEVARSTGACLVDLTRYTLEPFGRAA